MTEKRNAHGMTFPSTPDSFPGDVQHLVSPIVGMIRYQQKYPINGIVEAKELLAYAEERLAFLLELAEDMDTQMKELKSNGV